MPCMPRGQLACMHVLQLPLLAALHRMLVLLAVNASRRSMYMLHLTGTLDTAAIYQINAACCKLWVIPISATS